MPDNNYADNRFITGKVTSAAESLARKLNQEIEKGNDTSAFMIAMMLAAAKDFLDVVLTFAVIGLIPGVNFVASLFLSTVLFFFLLGKGWFLKTRIRIMYWVLGFLVDGLPAIGVLPMNVILVAYAWRLTKKRKGVAEEKLKMLNKMTENEMQALNNDISLLEGA